MRTRTCVYRCLVISNKTKKRKKKNRKNAARPSRIDVRPRRYVYTRTYIYAVRVCVRDHAFVARVLGRGGLRESYKIDNKTQSL